MPITCALAASPMAWVAIWKPRDAARVGEREHLGIRMELQPARVRLVGIGLLQPRAARAERAVGEQLDPDHAQPVAVQPRRRVRARPPAGSMPVSIDHQPDLSRPASPARRIASQSAVEVLIDADARSRRSRAGCPAPWPAPASISRRRRRRDGLVSIRLPRVVDEQAVRRSRRRPPAAWVAAVTPAAFIAALLATTAWPSTRSSTTGRSLTTASRSAAVGKRLSGHSSWFQPKPDDPARFWDGGGIGAQPLLQVGDRAGAGQVELQRGEAEVDDMAVRVDQAGQQRRARRRRSSCVDRPHARASRCWR